MYLTAVLLRSFTFFLLLSKVLKFGMEVIVVSGHSFCCSSEKKAWMWPSYKPLQRFSLHISLQSHLILAEKSI